MRLSKKCMLTICLFFLFLKCFYPFFHFHKSMKMVPRTFLYFQESLKVIPSTFLPFHRVLKVVLCAFLWFQEFLKPLPSPLCAFQDALKASPRSFCPFRLLPEEAEIVIYLIIEPKSGIVKHYLQFLYKEVLFFL